jgi:hypothetical protein
MAAERATHPGSRNCDRVGGKPYRAATCKVAPAFIRPGATRLGGGESGSRRRAVKPPGQVEVLPEPKAVDRDVDDVAVMREAVDQRAGHYIVAEALSMRTLGSLHRQDRRSVARRRHVI